MFTCTICAQIFQFFRERVQRVQNLKIEQKNLLRTIYAPKIPNTNFVSLRAKIVLRIIPFTIFCAGKNSSKKFAQVKMQLENF